MKISIVPCDLDEANAFVRQHHRHHGVARGYKFALAVAAEDEQIHGVAIVGRPIARHKQDGMTLEVTRVATDGTKNACSMLYAAAWRAARAMGYRKLITYTFASESGVSLRAAGWVIVGSVTKQSWDRPSRPRVDKTPLQDKLRWEAA